MEIETLDRKRLMPQSRDEWLGMRKPDITSTDCAALFNLSPYCTKFELWHHKKNGTEPDFKMNQRMQWGLRLESAIAHGVAEDLGLQIQSAAKQYHRVTAPRIGSSFDFFIIGQPKGVGILEIKMVDYLQYRDKWTEEEAPPHIELQVQHQMLVRGVSWCIIAALVGGNTIKMIKRKADPLLQHEILRAADHFWLDVEDGVEPDPVLPADTDFISKYFTSIEPDKVAEDYDSATLLQQYLDARTVKTQAEFEMDTIKGELFNRHRDANKIDAGRFAVGCGMTKDAPAKFITVTDEMVGEQIEISKARKGYRQFRVKELKQ